MYSPVLSVPARSVSAWVAETDPKQASAWLATLPLGNSGEAAREIYQALYTVNRLELRVQNRLDLMAMYDRAGATVSVGLQSYLLHEVPPLGPKKRQLAEFLRRLHIEMAYGYKCCLRDLSRARLSLRRKGRSALCIERALFHLSEVLLRSYVVYLPYPAGIWREIHELYRLAESLAIADNALDVGADGAERATSIGERYVQTAMLGLTNPYQLPHDAARQVDVFLARWGMLATIAPRAAQADVAGRFLIDLESDAPPAPLAKSRQRLGENARLLDAHLLLQTVQRFAARLEQGEQVERLELGVDCLDSACADLLQRMIRAWGEIARRRYARRQQSSSVFLCIGLNSVHYYANGQRPFASYVESLTRSDPPLPRAQSADMAFIELDDLHAEGDSAPPPEMSETNTTQTRRIHRWQLRDIGPQGMSLTRYSDAIAPTRVGDLVGVQQPADLGRWRVAVVRWVKTPEVNSLEIGIEMLAAGIAPAVARRGANASDAADVFAALQLPAAEVTQRPATLVLPRGACSVGDTVELLDEESPPRQVRILRLLERTGSFEHVVYGDVEAPLR